MSGKDIMEHAPISAQEAADRLAIRELVDAYATKAPRCRRPAWAVGRPISTPRAAWNAARAGDLQSDPIGVTG
jgi:hypothetical protein